VGHIVRFDDIARSIRSGRPRCGGVRLVAIDGPGGAGKSVFADRLERALGGVPVVHTDDFASWDNPHDWWDRMETTVLDPIERGVPARFQAYDWVEHRLGEWRAVPQDDVVIIEGVTSSRRTVADRLTVAVWIETPRATRLARGIARDGESMRPEWDAWMEAEDAFFERDRARERADVVVDGAPTERHDPDAEFVGVMPGRLPGDDGDSANPEPDPDLRWDSR
jgi:uridine kinase